MTTLRAAVGTRLITRRRGMVTTILLVAYAALLPFQIQVSESLRVAFADVILLAAIALNVRRLRISRDAISVWHILLFSSFLLGAAWTLGTEGHLTSWAIVNKLVGVAWLFAGYLALTWFLSGKRDAEQTLRWFVASVVVTNVLFGTAFLAGWEVPIFPQFQSRLSGGMVDPNAYGGLLVLAFVNTLGFARRSSSGVVWWFGSATLLVGILLTNSRSAWIALGLVLILLAWAYPKLSLSIIGFLAAIALAGVFLTGFGQQAAELAQRNSTISTRLELNQGALDLFVAQPLTGHGLGVFVAEADNVPHTTLLWLIADLGILAGVAFLGLCWWIWQKGRREIRDRRMLATSLMTTLIIGHAGMVAMSLGIEAFMQRHWWFQMALIVVAAREVQADVEITQSMHAHTAPELATLEDSEVTVRTRGTG